MEEQDSGRKVKRALWLAMFPVRQPHENAGKELKAQDVYSD